MKNSQIADLIGLIIAVLVGISDVAPSSIPGPFGHLFVFIVVLTLASRISGYIAEYELSEKIEKLSADIGHNKRLVETVNQRMREWKETQRTIIVDNVRQDHHWSQIEGYLWLYNALWMIPEDRFTETFANLLHEKKIPWRVIFFEGDTPQDKLICERRTRKMKKSITRILSKYPEVAPLIEVRKASQRRLPQISFFLFKDEGRPVARVYIDELTQNDVPRIAFDIYDADIYGHLEAEFDRHWSDAEPVQAPFALT
ncbi:MAG: hypothetical protein KGM97_01010 [Alphaproteobacteria bacterium]|nr:hypothetical protein [Alphaproteobacteria bacterium]MDE2629543.1 hypothetical protein [Alphaproteobacteria bacterium]